jgi:glucose-fructose oxidoreductase
MEKPWRIAGINFDHMHMGELLSLAAEHPHAEVVGVCDDRPERMRPVAEKLKLPAERIFTDYRACLEKTKPNLVVLCPATARHGEWTEKVAPYGVHIFMEKPFAATLAEADRMIAAVAATGQQLVINWPLRWYPCHVTAKRLVDEGAIGELIEVHYYDGNCGLLKHVTADVSGVEWGTSPDGGAPGQAQAGATRADVLASLPPGLRWFYRRREGGGSLLDYLGYGVTLGTWFMNSRTPLEVTTVIEPPRPGLEVDEHSITVARYETGLSKFETRWGTFNSPWEAQPQPKCGFVLVGRKGTISSYDYEPTIRLQDEAHRAGRDIPVDQLQPPEQNPIQYVLHCLENQRPIEGPLSPKIARIGQQIVESAVQSAAQQRTVPLAR